MSEDPIGFGGGLNFYEYVGSSPTVFTDPLGLAKCADPKYCRKLLIDIVSKTNKFFNDFRPYKDSGFVDKGGKWSSSKQGYTVERGHYTQLREGQGGLMRDILDYIANCMNEGDPPPPEFKEAFDAAKTPVPEPSNRKSASEMRDEAESNRQMERFWEKVLLADIAIGAVLLRPPLPVL